MNEWVDCDERMPDAKNDEVSVTVLCYLGCQMVVSGYRDYTDDEWIDFDGDAIDDVYFWMSHPVEP